MFHTFKRFETKWNLKRNKMDKTALQTPHFKLFNELIQMKSGTVHGSKIQ